MVFSLDEWIYRFVPSWTQGVTSDTACSSSLVALDTAAANIGRNRCSASVSAGVNMNLLPGPFVACCQVSGWHEDWGGLWQDHQIGWNFTFCGQHFVEGHQTSCGEFLWGNHTQTDQTGSSLKPRHHCLSHRPRCFRRAEDVRPLMPLQMATQGAKAIFEGCSLSVQGGEWSDGAKNIFIWLEPRNCLLSHIWELQNRQQSCRKWNMAIKSKSFKISSHFGGCQLPTGNPTICPKPAPQEFG